MRIFYSFFLVVLFGVSLHAQQNNYILVKGQVVDQKTNKPIAYAHVGIPERGIGTTTAGNGSFLLKVPNYYSNSKLTVSFLGYKTYERPISTIDKYLTIGLKAVSTDLQEVVVMDERRVENIIATAVRRIPKNYPTHGVRMTGFYRESKTDSDKNYLYMAEGVLTVYKSSYHNKRDGELSLKQGRKVDLVPPDSMRNVGFTSGHWSPHRFDFVKNREDFIDKNYFPVYKYWVSGITEYNGRPVYVISFDKDESAGTVEVEAKSTPRGGGLGILSVLKKKKTVSDHARMKGKLYIDTLSYAFLRAEFEFRPEALKRYNNYPLYVGRWQGNKYVVNYRQVGDQWYFSESLREGLYRDGGLYSNEFVITEIEPGKSSNIPYMERIENHVSFRRNTGFYDHNFWRDYNVKTLDDALSQSVDQMNRRNLAAEAFDTTTLLAEQNRRDSIELAEIEQLELQGFELDDVLDEMGERQTANNANIIRRRRRKVSFHQHFGVGVHLLQSDAATMSTTYNVDDQNSLSVTAEMPARNFEVVAPIDFALVVKDRWFISLGYTPEFYNSIYKLNNYGGGLQFNLSRGRPFYLKTGLNFTDFKYARKIGQTENTFGKFEANDKNIREGAVNMYYGNRLFSIGGTLELALELNPGTELFVRGNYLLPFAQQSHIYLWERKRLFRRKDRVELNQNISVQRNDSPFDGDIARYRDGMLISIGLVKKTY
ncbi:MAG: carboxypeptidase-like regulatory domain-containing protein [Bacteroidota bacterium]